MRPHRLEAAARKYFFAWHLRLEPTLRRAAVDPMFQIHRRRPRGVPWPLVCAPFVAFPLLPMVNPLVYIVSAVLWSLCLLPLLKKPPSDGRGKLLVGAYYPLNSDYRLLDAWCCGFRGRDLPLFISAVDRVSPYFLPVLAAYLGTAWIGMFSRPLNPQYETLHLCSIVGFYIGIVLYSIPSSSLDAVRPTKIRILQGFLPGQEEKSALRQILEPSARTGAILIAAILLMPMILDHTRSQIIPALLLHGIAIGVIAFGCYRIYTWRRTWFRYARAQRRSYPVWDAAMETYLRREILQEDEP